MKDFFVLYLLLLVFTGLQIDNNLFNEIVIHSDSMYLPAFWHDVWNGVSLVGWSLTPSPYFFPDLLLYAPFSLIPHTILAFVLYGSLQLSIILFLHDRIYRLLHPSLQTDKKHGFLLSSILIVFIFFLLFPRLYFNAIAPANHTGNYILLLIASWLFLQYDQKRTLRYLTTLSIIIFGALLSDQLFIVTFAIPFGFLLLNPKKPFLFIKYSLLFLILQSLATILLSWIRHHLLFIPKVSLFTLITKTFSFQLFTDKTLWDRFIAQNGSYLVFTLFLVLFWFMQNKNEKSYQNIIYFYLFSISITLVSFLTTGFLITNDFPPRYIQSIYLGWLFLGLMLLQKNRWFFFFIEKLKTSLFHYTIIILFIISATWFFFYKSKTTDSLVACLSKDASFQYGLGDYWHAKKITFLTENKIKVNQLTQSGEIYHWINNLAWYPHQPYTFLIPQGINAASIISKIGKADEKKICNEHEIWMYHHGQLQQYIQELLKNMPNTSAYLWKKNVLAQ